MSLIALTQDTARGVALSPASPSVYSSGSLLHLSPLAAGEDGAAAARGQGTATTAAAAAAAGRDSLEKLLSQAGCGETPKPRESIVFHFIYSLLLAAFPSPFVSFRYLCISRCRLHRQEPLLAAAAAASASAAAAADADAADTSTTSSNSSSSNSSSSNGDAETEEVWRLLARLVSLSVSSPRQPVSLLWTFCLVTTLDRIKPAKEHFIASKRVNPKP